MRPGQPRSNRRFVRERRAGRPPYRNRRSVRREERGEFATTLILTEALILAEALIKALLTPLSSLLSCAQARGLVLLTN